jgi:membrane peptidoglycan carboxypeptidase
VDLVEATQRSVNTAYYELGLEVGPSAVAELAHRAGIPDDVPLVSPDGTTNGSISLGGYEVHVIDQAVGFATFANAGVPARPYFVQNVQDRDGAVVYTAQVETGERAFSEDTAADATFAMRAVVQRGTGRGARLEGGRPAAGKSGTSSDNRDAWFVGFTPQLSTAVWIGYKTPQPIAIDGVEVTGGGFASPIWKAYTDGALAGQPVLELPEPVFAGRRTGRQDAPSARPRPSRTAEPSPTPTPVEPTAPPVEEPVEEPAPEPPPAEEPPADGGVGGGGDGGSGDGGSGDGAPPADGAASTG